MTASCSAPSHFKRRSNLRYFFPRESVPSSRNLRSRVRTDHHMESVFLLEPVEVAIDQWVKIACRDRVFKPKARNITMETQVLVQVDKPSRFTSQACSVNCLRQFKIKTVNINDFRTKTRMSTSREKLFDLK